jgi:hypothetical protein
LIPYPVNLSVLNYQRNNVMQKIVVTRYPEVSQYLIQRGLVPEGTPVHYQADPSTVRGKHVFGALPFHLAAEAGRVTIVTLHVPKGMDRRSMTAQELDMFIQNQGTFQVIREEN